MNPAAPLPLRGLYINLPQSQERRAAMQAQLLQLGLEGVQRFEAQGPDSHAKARADGIADTELACFRAHAAAVTRLAQGPCLGLVLEDDAQLAASLPTVLAHPALRQALAAVDLVFLECQPDIAATSLLALWGSRQRRLAPPPERALQGFDLLEARGLYRWGAVAYLLSPAGAQRLAARLADELAAGPVAPYDLSLRRWIDEGTLRAAVLSPFLATARLDSYGHSTVAPHRPARHEDVLGGALRRLLFAGPTTGLAEFVAPSLQSPLSDDPELQLLADLQARLFMLQARAQAR